MLFRSSLLPLILVSSGFVFTGCVKKINHDNSPEAEARRLLERANAYVSSVKEGDYSYNYVQFYWRRAQSNMERIERVYGDTQIGRSVKLGETPIGPFDTEYYRERVLPRLEVKRLASFNAVNCAIFLYNLPENANNTPARQQTLRWIAEYLSRAKRYSEALTIPVVDDDRPLLLGTVVRVACTYGEDAVVQAVMSRASPAEQAYLQTIVAEAIAFRGATVEQLDLHRRNNLLDTPEIREAQFRGVVRREIALRRAERENLQPKSALDGVDGIQRPDLRHDVPALAKTLLARPTPESAALLARFDAATGQTPESPQISRLRRPEIELARMDNQAAEGNWSAVEQLANDGRTRLHRIYLLAYAGKLDEASAAIAQLSQQEPGLAEEAALQLVRGQMFSHVVSYPVNPDTFAALPIKDPNRLAQLILEWSLTPNRRQRGMLPWDAIVYKFGSGWENLPLPPTVMPSDSPSNTLPVAGAKASS